MRQYCPRCNKALKACICQWIQPVDTKTELLILQHPTEVKRAIGTARILDLSLATCQVMVGEDFTEHEGLNQALTRDDIDWYLLYPGEFATPASQLVTQSQRNIGFILLDGTWKKAYKIMQLSSNLHALPCCFLDDVLPGRYRIRKTSKQTGVSTVEAGYFALRAVEPSNNGLDALLVPFDKMIDYQLQQMTPDVARRNYSER
ncbi:tRNA-uridine aminocarboxypropyltransferase [Thaumasiovibrio sp. DFM-14]|uniref:tRNA-uridine aminocarboxypropyltransferase n=1 Tax=Thaumasiovibrio sp. DFM-14 TaxID=3384792 RepID=UPI0039A1C780